MENKTIIEFQNELNNIFSELQALQEEKKNIMVRYKNAKTEVEKKNIEKEMKLSEFKFKKLNNKSIELKNKIKNNN